MPHNPLSRENLPVTIHRVWNMSIQGFGRHGLMSVAATSVMAVTLFSLLSVLLVRTITSTAVAEINQRLDLVADVNDDADIARVIALVRELRLRPDVISATYVSKDDALNKITSDSSEEDVKTFLRQYHIENPLSAKIHIVTQDPSEHNAIITFLKRPPNNRLISVQRAENDPTYQGRIRKLIDITDGIRKAGVTVTLVFVIVAFLIILNMIRITIHNRAPEIEIMQLVGAHDIFVEGPLLIESILYGLCGTVISTTIFIILMAFIGPELAHYFDNDTLIHVPFLQFLGIEILASIIVGGVSALVAMQKYMKHQVLL